ncbi:MAG TPA: DUF4397 domain-containing protein [Nocardioides sp.]|nr:DUF4397 domain-containing protein [Nocardioides sp.]
MNRTTWIALVSSMAVVGAATMTVGAAQAAPQGKARLMVVQALPGQSVDVSLDGDAVGTGADTGSVLGPFDLAAGQHEVTFSDASGDVLLTTDVSLASDSNQDLVVHLPAEVGGDPVATQYTTPTEPLGTGKARVMIAHTASVAPADVRVDGTVVFRNIANGEFAVADVAAGNHVAELLPSGLTTRPILGPIDVNLAARTATMVYAVGDPSEQSMEVIAHSISLSDSTDAALSAIDTGSAGLAAGIGVAPFLAPTTGPDQPAGRGPSMAVLGILLGLALAVVRRRRVTGDASS